MSRDSRSPAAIGSSSASRPKTRTSIWRRRGLSSRHWGRGRCPPLRTRDRITTLNAELAEPAEHIFSANSAVSALIVVALLLAGSACRQDMHDQPKYIPLRESTFFADGRSARAPVAGTVARDELHEDVLLYTGKLDGRDATVFPFAVDEKVMARGQERYDIYC